jgi:ATP-binding cassette subfamily F protein 3
MIIVQGKNLAQSFGANDIFEGIDLRLNFRERVGLVGPNGCGKTTLLQLVAGWQQPREGELTRAADLTVGYLQQEAVLTFAGQENTVYEEMLTVFARLTAQEAELRRLEAQMEAGDYSEAVLGEYGRIQEAYDVGGGYQFRHDIKRVLHGLGFAPDDWDTPLAHLSGGQKTRVLLGRLLLEQPALLILDEPTNHLDMTAVEWLEATLRTWPGTLLIVSHDRYFLDRVVTHIWDLAPTQLKAYKGSYTTYIQQRELEWTREEELFQAEKARMEAELEFVRKHIAGGKTDIAKGKLKRLTRDLVLVEEHGVTAVQGKSWLQIGERVRTLSVNEATQRLRELPSPNVRRPRLNIKLKPDQRSGRWVLRSKKLQIGYPGVPLFASDDLELERKECAALIGANGSGKSTFLRTLMTEIPPLQGKLRFGDDLMRGYFAQGHEQLTLENRVLDELLTHQPMSVEEARNYLAQYLFRGDDVFKRVGDLSGGERGRLALALLALDGANFLLLDEPTNHLDIPSQEVLQAVLEQFEGTIVLVSHDRYLVDRLATQIWELRDGRLHLFMGTYQEFLAAREGVEGTLATGSTKVALPTGVKELPAVDVSWVAEIAAEKPRINKQGRRERSQRLRDVQEQLEETEAWLDQLDYALRLAEMGDDVARQQELEQEAAVAQQQFEQLSTELEALLES